MSVGETKLVRKIVLALIRLKVFWCSVINIQWLKRLIKLQDFSPNLLSEKIICKLRLKL